ncbi:MAG: glycosyltransferase family 2 protein [Chloroflexi bacterium]|nr:glycosyltransferase family 2 protein [Chloroflexota bacterium]
MNGAKPKASTSIIIVTYNGSAYLEQCLTSVQQDAGTDCEIIIIDNASTDDSADFVQSRYPEVMLVRNTINRGFAAACNQGADIAVGRVLVFLNQDTHVEPGWLSSLARGLDGEEIGLTTSKILLMSQPERIHLCGQDVHYTGLVFGRGFLFLADDMNTPKAVAAVSGASFAVRRQVWEELGGFDETLYMYYEETDLSWRAQLVDYKCLYTPGSVVFHDYHLSRPNPYTLYYSNRNRSLLLLKNWKYTTLLLLAPGLVLAELIEWGLALAYGWRGVQAKARANLWILTHLRDISKLHARTQAERKVSDATILKKRADRLGAKTVTGGPIGRIAIAACNTFFSFHRRATRLFCQVLNL